LAARLLDDQSRRWQEGDRVRVEAYLEQHPELRDDPEGLLDLIFNEILLREEQGEVPDPAEYAERFPWLADQLRLHFAVHQFMQPETVVLSGSDREGARPAAAGLPEIAGYEVLGEIGRGGMGVVYQARHRALRRLVALKMILAGPYATAQEVRRLQVEAEAIARVQHPNIVQIYEVDVHDGRPYLALEYVDGDRLDRHIGGAPQPARESAELIETLARAVHAAHQAGIIHRDLKPANILLVSGESLPLTTHHSPLTTPKITDFGLAKQLEDGGLGPTQTGDFVGTPAYAAPEQALGNLQEIGPATDVYALGAILYELLTGRPPFQAATPLETLVRVRTEEPLPPRHLQPKLPRDLETICLKCLHKEPRRRYASALDLAEDLRRFLEGRPIQARPVGMGERFWRWCRRNPAIARLTAALFLALAVGLIATTFLWLRADRKEAEATANFRLAEQERTAAQQARARAEQGFRKAKQAVDECFNLVSKNELLRRPEMKPVRKLLVDATLKYYQEFLAQHGDDPAVQKETAEIFNRAGVIHQAIGRTPDALAAYEHARELWSQLVTADAADTDCWQGLAKAQYNLSILQAEQKNYPAAIGAADEAVRIRRRLAAADPKFQINLAKTLTLLGVWYDEAGQRAEALPCYQEAERILRSLASANPTDVWVQVELARCCDNAGNCYVAARQPEEALRSYEESRRLHQQLADKHPAEPLYARNVAIVAVNLSGLHLEAGRPAAAGRALEEARQILEGLTATHPQDNEYQFLLAYCLAKLGAVHEKTGRTATAVRLLEEARAIQERLLAKDPKALKYQEELARICYNLGSLQRGLGRTSASLQFLERGRQLWHQLLKERPGDRDYQRGSADALSLIGLHHLDRRPEEAHALFEEALRLRRELAERDPADPERQRELAQSYSQVASAGERLGRPTEALPCLDQARRIDEALLANRPDNPDACAHLGEVLGQRILLLEKLGRGPEAHAAGQQALDCQLRALRLGQDLGALRVSLSSYLATLARWRGDSGQAAAAAAKVLGGSRPWGGNPFRYARAGWGLVWCIPLVGQGQTAFTAEEEAERRLYAELALSAFRQAGAAPRWDTAH
jgi:tetratricopeptide (TPR) repeat protein